MKEEPVVLDEVTEVPSNSVEEVVGHHFARNVGARPGGAIKANVERSKRDEESCQRIGHRGLHGVHQPQDLVLLSHLQLFSHGGAEVLLDAVVLGSGQKDGREAVVQL